MTRRLVAPAMKGRRPSARAALVAVMMACGSCRTSTPVAPVLPAAPDGDVSEVLARDPGSTLGAEWTLGPFAELYVRGYKDSNGDGIGDLRGVTQQLDYLKALGVTGIWLMPVNTSQDKDHGYAVTDYRAIEPQYGTLADFDDLVRQAHARGIGVIMDYVINHSAGTNPLFLNSLSASTSARRNWYVWSVAKPLGWSVFGKDPWYQGIDGWYYAAFYDQMPEFNLRNPFVVAYHQNNLRFWLNRGVDGFRFDAVGNLVENGPNGWRLQPESYAVMGSMRATLSAYVNRYMVCESPDDPLGFAAPTACGGSFAFVHNYDVMNAVRGNSAAVTAVANYFTNTPAGLATMLANHDGFAGERIWDQVGGDVALYKLAAATYLLQPGVPFIYYGEEVGMAGGAGLSGDHRLRAPMSWTAEAGRAGFTTGSPFRALSANVASYNVRAEEGDPSSLLSYYRTLIALRKAHPSLSRGTYEHATVNSLTMSFTRTAGGETSLIAINYGNTAATLTFSGLTSNVSLLPLFPAGASSASASPTGQFSTLVPPHAAVVFAVAR